MSNDILRQANDAITRAATEVKRLKGENSREVASAVNAALVPILTPYLNQLIQVANSGQGQMRQSVADALSELKSGIKDALSNLKLDSIVHDIKLPEILVPNIPDVRVNIDTSGIEAAVTRAIQNVKINVPTITVPPVVMPDRMKVGMEDFGPHRPLPVRMMDEAGKPFTFSMPGGGKSDFLTIKGIMGSAFGELVNPDGRLLVELPTGSSGLTDDELRATAVPVSQVSGATWSVSVNDIFRSTVATALINGDDRLRVSVETGGSGLTDAELRATAVPVDQVSGAIWSTEVTNTVTVSATDLDIRDLTATDVVTANLSAVDNAVLDAIAASVADVDTNTDGIEGLLTTIDADTGGILADTAAIETAVQIMDDWDGVHGAAVGADGARIMAEARTSNPTAVDSGDNVRVMADDLGRQVMRPVQVRDLIKTAYVSVTGGSETTLRAAVAGSYLDCIMIVGSNNCTAAVSVDIRAVTGGNIVHTLRIPADGTAGWAPHVPWPQDETGNNWTVDGPDETGRTLTFSALFSQEI